jgi:hypothetical protein
MERVRRFVWVIKVCLGMNLWTFMGGAEDSKRSGEKEKMEKELEC